MDRDWETMTDKMPRVIQEAEDKLQMDIKGFIQRPSYKTAASVYKTFKTLCNHHGMSMFRVELAAVSKRKHRKKSGAQ